MSSTHLLTLRASYNPLTEIEGESNAQLLGRRAADQDRWAHDLHSPLLLTFPDLPWETAEGSLPRLPSALLTPYIGLCAKTPKLQTPEHLGGYVLNPESLGILRELWTAGIDTSPVNSLTAWAKRVSDLHASKTLGADFCLIRATHFDKQQLHPDFNNPVCNKIKWVHFVSPDNCAQAHSGHRLVPWVELQILLGPISLAEHQANGAPAVAMAWAIVTAIATIDNAVDGLKQLCEKSDGTPSEDTVYDTWAEALAINILQFWQRTEWPEELSIIESSSHWRSSEVARRVQYQSDPALVIASRMDTLLDFFQDLKEYSMGACSSFVTETVEVVAAAACIRTTHLQRVRDVNTIIASFSNLWEGASQPHQRLTLVLQAIRDEEKRDEQIKFAAKSGTRNDTNGDGASLLISSISDKAQWSNLLQGKGSAAFIAMVAELNVLLASELPDACSIIETCYRGAKDSTPVHAMQLFMSASLKSAIPAIHPIFALVAPYRHHRQRYFAECAACPQGFKDISVRIKQFLFLNSNFTAFLGGKLADFDACLEMERIEAAKLAVNLPLRNATLLRYLNYSDFDVGPVLLCYLLKARGLDGTDKEYNLSRVSSWCKEYIKKVLNAPASVLSDHLATARAIFMAALLAAGEHCIIIRGMGPIDAEPLKYQIPPQATVWEMIAAAEEALQTGINMRAYHPSLAQAVDMLWQRNSAMPTSNTTIIGSHNTRSNNNLAAVPDSQLSPDQMAKREANRSNRKRKAEVKAAAHQNLTTNSGKQSKITDFSSGTSGKGSPNQKGGKGAKGSTSKGAKGAKGAASGKGNTSKGSKGGKGSPSRPQASWDGPDNLLVDGVRYSTTAKDGTGRNINQALDLGDPLCWPWACKKGACMRREHAQHQGDQAEAHCKNHRRAS